MCFCDFRRSNHIPILYSILKQMQVTFQLDNKRASFTIDGNVLSNIPIDVTLGQMWSSACAKDIVIDERVFSVSWQAWNQTVQYVQIREHIPDIKKTPWVTISRWSYTNDEPVRHSGKLGSVTVVNSPYGDFCYTDCS